MSDIADFAITIPVLNQLGFTQGCLDSLSQAGFSDSEVIIVNNGSTDGTREFLATRPALRTIHNESNLGCGGGWTQGAKAANATWTVVLNNDVLVPPGCLEALYRFAVENRLDVVSPAMCEGECDYDWRAYAADFMSRMCSVRRNHVNHGVCFLVHRRVFDAIGYFCEDARLGGYEDDEFFRRVCRAGFRQATTGAAFLHHFGSMTQRIIKDHQKADRVLDRRTYYRQQTGQTWHICKCVQFRNRLREHWWRLMEKSRFGHTLKERRINGRWEYY